MILAWVKAKAAWIGAIAIAVAAFLTRIEWLKFARDRAEQRAEIAEARLVTNKVQAKIALAKKKALADAKAKIETEVTKEGDDFEGLDNLSNTSKWVRDKSD